MGDEDVWMEARMDPCLVRDGRRKIGARWARKLLRSMQKM